MSNDKKNDKKQIINFVIGIESGNILYTRKNASSKTKEKPKPYPEKKSEHKK